MEEQTLYQQPLTIGYGSPEVIFGVKCIRFGVN